MRNNDCLCGYLFFLGRLKLARAQLLTFALHRRTSKKSTAFSERRGLAGTLRAEIQVTRDKMRDNIAGNIYLASI